MREYTNFPKNIENNNNIVQEVKKPKLYLLTSKIVNLFAIFVASISVSTFFATRYIGIGDIFFSANIFSTMLSVAIFIVILEIYGRKNTIKAFMAGAYAILLVFFISVFITDFNPTPIGYYQSSFINFHQTILLSVFISYVVSFLICIKVYLYMKDDLDITYLWVKAIPAIAVSQIVYTISYYLIYNGFNNLDIIVFEIKNELYLKLFMIIVDVLIIYFIISGIKSGFFDIFKNIFSSKNIRHIDNYEHQPIKHIYEESKQREIPYSKQISLEDYRVKQRGKRYLPDYSEEDRYYDSPREDYQRVSENKYNKRNEPNYENQQQSFEKESRQQSRSNRKGIPTENKDEAILSRSNRKASRKAVRSRPISRNFNTQENSQENNSSNTLDRSRNKSKPTISRPKNRVSQNIPKIVGINNTATNMSNLSSQQQNNNQMNGFSDFGGNNQFTNKLNPIMKNQNNSFGNNSSFGVNNQFGNKFGQQNQQSFFANKLTPNNKPKMGGFGNMNKNNLWNKR